MERKINSQSLTELFKQSSDVILRPIKLNQNGITMHLFAVDGLSNSTLFDQAVLQTIILDDYLKECKTEQAVLDYFLLGGAYHTAVKKETDCELMIKLVLSGMVALFFDEIESAIVYDIRGFDKRSVAEPEDEGVVKGAKDSFVETMRTNTAQIRRRVRSEYLQAEMLTVGRISKTDMTLMYISNIANMETVNRIKEIINNIDIDNIATPAFIEEYLNENIDSLFPQIMYTQRPDRASSNLSDGRIALVVDGMPFVYILPCQLVMLMQSPEDYANHFAIGSFLRLLRYLAVVITLFLPAFYIAATTYQNQMFPVKMALATQAAKQNVPFSSAAEVIGLLIAFEILIESGLRLPKSIGTAMSILGGLVVGQAAVSASLISPAVVVIVSLAGISGFLMPNQDLSSALRVVRFIIALLAAFAGFFGMVIGLILLIVHLCSLDNYGVAYLAPFVDRENMNHKDTLIRFPIRFFTKRPTEVVNQNITKQKTSNPKEHENFEL